MAYRLRRYWFECGDGIMFNYRMWANAQRDGRLAEYRWRPLFNAAKFGSRPLVKCRAKTRNPLKLAGVPQTNETISFANGLNGLYCEGMWGRYCCLASFSDGAHRWRFLATFLRPVFTASCVQHVSDLHSKFAPKATPCLKVRGAVKKF